MRAMKEKGDTPSNEIYDIIIVGGGPGGLSAGIYAKRAAMKTVLIEKGPAGGQMAINKGIENYPGFIDINGFEMNANGYVVTDEKCETSICGIFAIGDLREKYANQIVVAASDGCISALAAARAVEMRKAGFSACKLQRR